MAWLITNVIKLRARVNELFRAINVQVELRRKYKRQRDALDSGLSDVHILIQEQAQAGMYNIEDMQEVLDYIEHYRAKGKGDG